MCQKGGKRCPRHMNGTKAVTNYASAISGLDEKQTNECFKELRVEGKERNLRAPSPAMQAAFLKTQRSIIQRDEEINDHKKKIISNQLTKAEKETPDGPTFYAWKNLVGRSILRKHGSKLTAIGVSTVLSFSLAACNGGEKIPTPEPTDTTISQSVTPSAQPSDTPSTFMDLSGNETKGFYASDETITDKYGTYNPLRVDPDAEFLQTDRSIYSPEVTDYFDDATVDKGKKVIANFVVDGWLDSEPTYIPTEEAREHAWKESLERITPNPKYKENFKNAFFESENIMYDNSPTTIMESAGYKAVYPSDGARVRVDQLEFTSVGAREDRLYYEMPIKATRQYINTDGEPELMQFKSTYRFVLQPDGKGGFLLNGWERTKAVANTIAE